MPFKTLAPKQSMVFVTNAIKQKLHKREGGENDKDYEDDNNDSVSLPSDVTAETQKAMFNDRKYSDLTVTCGAETFWVHRAILCPRIPFFEACCYGNFQEANSRLIDLKDDDPTSMMLLLKWTYYPSLSRPEMMSAFDGSITQATKLFLTADKYGSKDLKDQAFNFINLTFDLAIRSLNQATPVCCYLPPKNMAEDVVQFLMAVWGSSVDVTDEGVEVGVNPTVARLVQPTGLEDFKKPTFEKMRLRHESLTHPSIQACLRELPDLAVMLIIGLKGKYDEKDKEMELRLAAARKREIEGEKEGKKLMVKYEKLEKKWEKKLKKLNKKAEKERRTLLG